MPMSVFSDLLESRKLEYKHIWLFISAFLGTIAPGMLIIFHFKPEIMEKYDILKVVCLSLALTLPILIVNSFNCALLYHNIPDDSENRTTDTQKAETQKNSDITRTALLLNAIVIYLPFVICYFGSLRFKILVIMILVLEMFIFLVGLGQLRTKIKLGNP
jgi:hypothetical protein